MKMFVDRSRQLLAAHVLDRVYTQPVPKEDKDCRIETFLEGSQESE